MIFLKVFGPSIVIVLTVAVCHAYFNREKLKDRFMREKNSFAIAIEALRAGKTIHRSGEAVYYCSREVSYQGKMSTEYGYRISDREFRHDAHFDMNDVLANDWIIKENE